MKKTLIPLMLLGASLLVYAPGASQNKTRRLSQAVLKDKIRGGWAGQMIGVSFGAPTEFKSNGKIIEGELKWAPERVSNAIDQDDLYVEMTFTKVLDEVGLNATCEQFGEAFKDSKYNLWHANAGARRNLNRGVKAPWSGHPKYNFHANDIDFQIEADFIGMMTPGLPQEANKYADRVGRVMNYGDGLYGGVFVSGMYAAAFFETDPRKVVEAIKGGAAQCWTLDNKPERLFAGNRQPGFKAHMQAKDLHIVMDSAKEMGMPLPVTDVNTQLYDEMLEMDLGELDNSAVVAVIEKMAGIPLSHSPSS